MKLRAIRDIITYELTGFGADVDQAGQSFSHNQIWSNVVIDSSEMPSLSITAKERLKFYNMRMYPIHTFKINEDETEIEVIPDKILFSSIPIEVVKSNMNKINYEEDLKSAEEINISILELFPERYYEEDSTIKRKVDNKPADSEYIPEDEAVEENATLTEEVTENDVNNSEEVDNTVTEENQENSELDENIDNDGAESTEIISDEDLLNNNDETLE